GWGNLPPVAPVKAGVMVDRCSGTWLTGLARAQLVPVVHRRAPRRERALLSARRADGAGGACGPTGASVTASRSRYGLAQIEHGHLRARRRARRSSRPVGPDATRPAGG